MKKLIALLAAAGAVVFFWRKKQHEEDSMWDPARETTSSWGEAAADTPGEVADEPADDAE